jgi:TRAP-type uncharacterized transport system substrate-binding protein
MCRFITTAMLGLAFGLSAGTVWVHGQTLPKYLQESGQESGSEEATRQRLNQWTVFLGGGTRDSTWLRFADELGTALDDGDDMRVIPIISRGAAANLPDLLYLRGVDAAFTQLDVLDYFRTQLKTPHIEDRVQYVLRLPVAELHVTAGAAIVSLDDLRGRKVVFGGPGTASALTGPIVFHRLGIEVEPLFIDHAVGLRMLMDGDVAGLVGSSSKPVDFWLSIPSNAGLHLLPVPFTSALADLYVVGAFTGVDYPNLILPGQRIDTIAVPSVLAISNAPKTSDRFRRLERFARYLFNRWDRLTEPPFHPRWRDVNLAATVPGWTRFAPAEDLLRDGQHASGPSPSLEDFQTWLKQEVPTAPSSDAEREAMFRRFLIWREQHARQ